MSDILLDYIIKKSEEGDKEAIATLNKYYENSFIKAEHQTSKTSIRRVKSSSNISFINQYCNSPKRNHNPSCIDCNQKILL